MARHTVMVTVAELLKEDYPEPLPKDPAAESLKWRDLIRLEPRLGALLARARTYRPFQEADEHFCANRVWYGQFKPELCKLVGWDVVHLSALLGSPYAYDIAYRTIYDVLPDCRDCLCG